MLSLPIAFRSAIGVFAPVFSRPVWQHVKVLMTGAVLAPGKRTVTAILQVMGRSTAPDFQTYHRVLHRAVWSPLTASRLLLRLLVAVFVPRGVIVFGLDDTIERRRGEQITAKGIYRDPVRSSQRIFCQSQWPALAWVYVADPYSLGQPGLGLALSDGAVSLRALLCPAGPPPSHLAGPRLADDPARAALVAWPRGRLRGGQQFCGPGMARPGGAVAPGQCDHASAARCRSL